jgi:soluble lytic murein transglycosylase-like protein
MRAAWLVTVLLFGLGGGVARAEIAVLKNGSTFKISAWRVEGEMVYFTLKDGGELGTALSAVRGFVPDEVVEEIVERGEPVTAAGSDLRTLALEAARRHGLDPALVLAVVRVESGFRADAVSPKGAQGLMQLMPATAASLGVADPFDPAANLDGGVRHLRSLLVLYRGNLNKALAAYNAGAGAVERHRGVPPYPETQQYIRRVFEHYKEEP